MQTFSTHWTETVSARIFSRGWIPENKVTAAVCLVHGLGEHSGRYTHVAEHLTGAGFAVMAFDLYGHGQSEGKRGHAPSMKVFTESIDRLLQETSERWPEAPQFLYGHSLGGVLVLYYTLLLQPELAGVIATSPGLRTSLEEQKLKIRLARTLAILAPAASLPTGLSPQALSRDPQVVKAYQDDPLVHDRATFSMARNTLDAIEWTFANAGDFKPPLLLMHGDQDTIAFPRGSQEFAGLVTGDCTLKIWSGLRHETHNEPEKAQVLNFLVEWIKSKL
jgi:alpha-beta hydrolase superfamily lysophospholipase